MYLEKTTTDSIEEDLWTNNMDEGIQVVGGNDSFKLAAVYQLLEKLSPEPCEIFVLSPNSEHKQFWDAAGIPVVQDLKQIASVLRKLLQEFHARRKPFRVFIGNQINCVIELDDLHEALASQALNLGIEYDERELNKHIAVLRDLGPGVGITVVASTSKTKPCWNHCLYSGDAALRFAETASQNVVDEISDLSHPCCFAIASDIYLMSVNDRLSQFVPLAIELISKNKRAIDLQN